ncbi:MAG: hypothetical protein AAGC47_10365 [Bacteroidota bacterium]
MKNLNLLLLLSILLFASCNDDDDDDDGTNGNNPPAEQAASFTATLTDLVNGPGSAFEATTIEVVHDTDDDVLYVYLENDEALISFTIGGTSPGEYNLSWLSTSEAYLKFCSGSTDVLNTKPDDANFSPEVLGTITIDSFDQANGKLSLTISSLTMVMVIQGADNDVASYSITDASLVNADVTSAPTGVNNLKRVDIACLIDGDDLGVFMTSGGGLAEISNSIRAFGSEGIVDVGLPLTIEPGEYTLSSTPGEPYFLAYNTNDQASILASSGTLTVVEACNGVFYGTFSGEVEIANGTLVSVTEGRFSVSTN